MDIYIYMFPPIDTKKIPPLTIEALQSCHFRPELLSAPLAEAAGRGHLDVAQARPRFCGRKRWMQRTGDYEIRGFHMISHRFF